MILRAIATLIAALAATAPAQAAPNVFWTFGFQFPGDAIHRTGGFSDRRGGVDPASLPPSELVAAEPQSDAANHGASAALAGGYPPSTDRLATMSDVAMAK